MEVASLVSGCHSNCWAPTAAEMMAKWHNVIGWVRNAKGFLQQARLSSHRFDTSCLEPTQIDVTLSDSIKIRAKQLRLQTFSLAHSFPMSRSQIPHLYQISPYNRLQPRYLSLEYLFYHRLLLCSSCYRFKRVSEPTYCAYCCAFCPAKSSNTPCSIPRLFSGKAGLLPASGFRLPSSTSSLRNIFCDRISLIV